MEKGEGTFRHCRGSCGRGRGRGRLQGLSPLAQLKPSVNGSYHEYRILLERDDRGRRSAMPRVESPPLPAPCLRLRRPLCFFPRRRQAIRAHWLVLNPECWVSPAAGGRAGCMCAHLPRPAPRRVARRRWTWRAWSTATEGRREREGARMKTSQRKDGRDGRRRIGRRTKDGNVAPPAAPSLSVPVE